MGLLLQIGLTIAAIKGGWKKSIALIPLGACILAGYLIGSAVLASGGSIEDAAPVCLLVDVLSLAALGIMVARAPKRRKIAQPAKPAVVEGVQTETAN